jgi:hypothetical protein
VRHRDGGAPLLSLVAFALFYAVAIAPALRSTGARRVCFWEEPRATDARGCGDQNE